MAEIGPTIETARLILRPPKMEDFAPFAAFMGDEASRFVGGPQPRSAAWRTWLAIAGAWSLQCISMFSWIEKASGRWVGQGGPWLPEGWPGPEVGWLTAQDAQRNGYAKEATSAAISWAFDNLGWSEVTHCIDRSGECTVDRRGEIARLIADAHGRHCATANRSDVGHIGANARTMAP
jgi:RimJ/RimL family protein N-acetyltransferase